MAAGVAVALALHPQLHLIMSDHIGYAVVDLGGACGAAGRPAFAEAANSRLVAVVGATRDGAEALARESNTAGYPNSEYRQCLERTDVQAVYLVLPNVMRADYAVEAARAGVHVLCGAPMAVTADECRRVIRACQKAHVKLMVASEVQFQPAYVEARALTRRGEIGALKTMSADVAIRIDDAADVRLQRRMGGGTVYELGIACIAAARALFGAEPAQVMAMTARRLPGRVGGDVDEGTVALVRFPDEQLAHFHTSFGEEPSSVLTILGEDGYIRLAPAFSRAAEVEMDIVRGGRRETRRLPTTNGLTPTLEYFSDCILHDRRPEPDGIDGMQEVRIVEAIYRSARDGRPVTLPRFTRADDPPPAELRQHA